MLIYLIKFCLLLLVILSNQLSSFPITSSGILLIIPKILNHSQIYSYSQNNITTEGYHNKNVTNLTTLQKYDSKISKHLNTTIQLGLTSKRKQQKKYKFLDSYLSNIINKEVRMSYFYNNLLGKWRIYQDFQLVDSDIAISYPITIEFKDDNNTVKLNINNTLYTSNFEVIDRGWSKLPKFEFQLYNFTQYPTKLSNKIKYNQKIKSEYNKLVGITLSYKGTIYRSILEKSLTIHGKTYTIRGNQL